MQSAFFWAPKVARKCESKHWYACGADGRAAGGRAGGRCTVTWLPNFLGWVDLLTHGAPEARFARQSSAKTLYELIYRGIFYHSFFLFACEQSFQTASFCLKFWFFSSLRPRKLILSIFSKSKRPFGKQTTPRLVTYYYLSMDKTWAKFKFWVWPPVARYLHWLLKPPMGSRVQRLQNLNYIRNRVSVEYWEYPHNCNKLW